MKLLRWTIWILYIVIGVAAPLLCWKYDAHFNLERWTFVLLISACCAAGGIVQIYLEITRPKNLLAGIPNPEPAPGKVPTYEEFGKTYDNFKY